MAGSYQVLQDPGALPEVRQLVTGDVNAAIMGARGAGATDIWVNENHSAREMLLEEVDPIAEVIFCRSSNLDPYISSGKPANRVFHCG